MDFKSKENYEDVKSHLKKVSGNNDILQMFINEENIISVENTYRKVDNGGKEVLVKKNEFIIECEDGRKYKYSMNYSGMDARFLNTADSKNEENDFFSLVIARDGMDGSYYSGGKKQNNGIFLVEDNSVVQVEDDQIVFLKNVSDIAEGESKELMLWNFRLLKQMQEDVKKLELNYSIVRNAYNLRDK